MTRLEGKVALVTGGAQGMGASHARAIVAEGGQVVIGDVRVAAGTELAAELGDDCAQFVELDVTSGPSWDSAVEAAVAKFGKLNVLVNNAGILNSAPLGEHHDHLWDASIAVNLTGPFKGMRASVGELRKAAPASVINISSMAGMKGFPELAGYNASKFGIRGLTKSAAIELAADGIRVNTVCPGTVNTSMIDGLYPDDSFPTVPMHRVGQPDEISRIVVFLASDESSYATGQEFIFDGGELAGSPAQFG
jgi:3alpha(or 20beta)-hydroxysteroid dehydrogenase